MEALDKISDWFGGFTGGIERFITRLFGASNEKQIKKIGYVRDKQGNASIVPDTVLDSINRLEPEFQKLTDDELKLMASKLRERLANGEALDDLMPEAFAAVRESSWRYLKMRHYDVQMVGGYFLHNGIIAEMVTGEGKTLVATLPAFLNALTGSVHVVTVNDYLALRDMEWMGPVYMGLGLTVGAIQASMEPDERQGPYSCDITYGTNNEFGFDYLRDNMKPRKDLQVQGPLCFAIVDEIDNILIDEARTPLIISGSAHDDVEKYAKADRVVRDLMAAQNKADAELKRQQAELEPRLEGLSKREQQELQKQLLDIWKAVHCCYEVNEKDHSCHMTETGIRKAEELAGVESFYTAGNMEWPHLMDNALKAHHLYKKDVNYVVENGDVVIVDEFTGRKMEGRQWSDGLHQAVEGKERVTIKEETQTLATITLQNYFKLYKKLCGMTGTAMTEANEFWKIYKLDVIAVPTNVPLRRTHATDLIFRTESEKWDAIVDEIREVHHTGRPILVGTVSIEKSELLSSKLKKHGVRHEVLNAKYHEREAEIIAQAGRKAGVTIATNMAGRGTDIVLGGNPEHMAWEELKQRYESRLDVTKAEWDDITRKIAEREGMDKEGREVAELGGLHVIGSERHDSRRIDLQLRGRSGRQGDPGSSRFFLSLEDDLMRIFMGEWVKNMLTRLGMKDGEAIESRMVQKRVQGAQKKREEMHFESRKNLLEYDEVMDGHRKKVYSYRQQILDGASCRELILEMIRKQVDRGAAEYLAPMFRWETLSAWLESEMGVVLSAGHLDGMTKEQLVDYVTVESIHQAETSLDEQLKTDLPEERDASEWNWLSVSKWSNARWGLNTNDRELKKIGRDDLFDHLIKRAVDAIEKYDFSYADLVLEETYPERALCGWLNQQFAIEMEPEQFHQATVEDANELILKQVQETYDEKEVRFPVDIGMHNFLADRNQSERQGRENLLKWAADRFEAELQVDQFKNKSRDDLENALVDCSRQFRLSGDFSAEIEDYLDQAYGTDEDMARENGRVQSNGYSGNGSPGGNGHVQAEALTQLTKWANDEFRAELKPEDFEELNKDDARRRLLGEVESRFRPELSQTERNLLLEILDTAWKEHLYHMGHVKETIGLESYAGKDPKVEYKKEGRRAFNAMWERIGQQVTAAIFRLELESEEFEGTMWDISSMIHEDFVENLGGDPDQFNPDQPAIETIRNRGPRVGRNDPCPCGSGKKFKKCHGRGG